ncbi:hypothetical protein PR048_002322 [Dryococelus australis]|uniref:Uncharacterized protein n=1 Tax=Dryococelus australis TaxID=614101 RepID=A0ABQ9IKY5_9NEOP|nr:hypothetical protein PR048_002322 [Dryococelus australis]
MNNCQVRHNSRNKNSSRTHTSLRVAFNGLIVQMHAIARIDESESHNHGISLVQHFYIGKKIKQVPGLELGSFGLGSGKMWCNRASVAHYTCVDETFPLVSITVTSAKEKNMRSSLCGELQAFPRPYKTFDWSSVPTESFPVPDRQTQLYGTVPRTPCDWLTGSNPVLRLAGEFTTGLGRADRLKVRSLSTTFNCTRHKARTFVLHCVLYPVACQFTLPPLKRSSAADATGRVLLACDWSEYCTVVTCSCWCRRMYRSETGDPREDPPTSGIVRHDSRTCENVGPALPGMEPGSPRWEAGSLTTIPPWPPQIVAAIDLEAGVQTTPKVVKGTSEDMLRDGIDNCDNVDLESFESVRVVAVDLTGWHRLVCSAADDTIRLEQRLHVSDRCTCSMRRGSVLLKVSIVALILHRLFRKNIENVFDVTSRVHSIMEEHGDDAARLLQQGGRGYDASQGKLSIIPGCPVTGQRAGFPGGRGESRWIPLPPPLLFLSQRTYSAHSSRSPCRSRHSSAGMQGRGKREIPDKTRQPALSSITIPTTTREKPGTTPPGIEPGSPRRRNMLEGELQQGSRKVRRNHECSVYCLKCRSVGAIKTTYVVALNVWSQLRAQRKCVKVPHVTQDRVANTKSCLQRLAAALAWPRGTPFTARTPDLLQIEYLRLSEEFFSGLCDGTPGQELLSGWSFSDRRRATIRGRSDQREENLRLRVSAQRMVRLAGWTLGLHAGVKYIINDANRQAEKCVNGEPPHLTNSVMPLRRPVTIHEDAAENRGGGRGLRLSRWWRLERLRGTTENIRFSGDRMRNERQACTRGPLPMSFSSPLSTQTFSPVSELESLPRPSSHLLNRRLPLPTACHAVRSSIARKSFVNSQLQPEVCCDIYRAQATIWKVQRTPRRAERTRRRNILKVEPKQDFSKPGSYHGLTIMSELLKSGMDRRGNPASKVKKRRSDTGDTNTQA